MCSLYVLQIIFKKKMILQSKSPSFMCKKNHIFSLLEIDLLTLKMTFSHQNSTRIGYSVKITHKGPRNWPFALEYDFEWPY